MHTLLLSRTHASNERGSGAVLVLAITFACLILFALIAPVATVYKNRVHAQGAADLAALAAAEQWNYLGAQPCAVARKVATQNSAQLADCHVHGSSVQVAVVLSQPLRVLEAVTLPSAQARSRAGPAEQPD